jgi:glycosyltransferase involved in cell wall biosynthesis
MKSLSQVASVPFDNMYFKNTRTDMYVAPSRFTALSISRRFAIPLTKIAIVPEGVETKFETGDGSRIRERVGSGKIILFVGNLIYSKGVDKLLYVFQKISQEFEDTKLIIVGDGPLRNFLFEQVNRMGLQRKVFIAGFVAESELPDYYASCDLFASFSQLEGFGLTFAEAMMAGKPIVAFNTASIAEVVEDSGLLATPFNLAEMEYNIKKILQNDVLRHELSLRSKMRSAIYSWSRYADDLIQILNKVDQVR